MPTTTLSSPRRQVVQSSELSRHSAAVFAAAEKSPVEVTRRGGETLVLTTKRDSKIRERMFEVAAQLITVSLDDRGTLEDRLAQPFPWIKLLSTTDQKTCAREIIEIARGAFAISQPGRILTEIAAWRNTAEAVVAGWGNDEPDWLETPIVVENPRN